MWDIASSGISRIAFAAPRAHAKSTAITHALTLARFLFRESQYGIIVSDTEQQSSQFLGDIKAELTDNMELREIFGIKKIVKDAVTDVIVEMDDGHQFRIQALGAEQKMRGRKWGNKRPDYVCVDDLENDEMMENDTRREKLRNWFYKALIPSISKSGIIVVVGTILHMDSVLMRLMNNKSWTSRLYKSHAGFDDFSNLLWKEQWPESALRAIRQEYIDDGYAEGYSQEYLNDPISHSEAYFRHEDFKPIEEEMRKIPLLNYGAIDLAISDDSKAAYTVFVIGGMDQFRRLHIHTVLRFRGDAYEIINAWIELQRIHDVQLWKAEDGQIKKTLMGPLYEKMNESGVYMNLVPAVPAKDKRSRARAIQARMRAGGVYFDTEASWFPAFQQELLQFPKGLYKDQVDAIAWLGIAINELSEGPAMRDLIEDAYDVSIREFDEPTGQSVVTGY